MLALLATPTLLWAAFPLQIDENRDYSICARIYQSKAEHFLLFNFKTRLQSKWSLSLSEAQKENYKKIKGKEGQIKLDFQIKNGKIIVRKIFPCGPDEIVTQIGHHFQKI